VDTIEIMTKQRSLEVVIGFRRQHERGRKITVFQARSIRIVYSDHGRSLIRNRSSAGGIHAAVLSP
jgi:hypothetical protein